MALLYSRINITIMQNKKPQKESPFGCALTIFWGYMFIILLMVLFERKPYGKVDKWPGVLIGIYTVVVIIGISKTKFKSLDDYLK